MPKAAAYTLAWSAVRQAYIWYDHHAELNLTLDVGSPAWREWLEQTASFAFHGQRGVYIARREQIKPGDWYWYAYLSALWRSILGKRYWHSYRSRYSNFSYAPLFWSSWRVGSARPSVTKQVGRKP